MRRQVCDLRIRMARSELLRRESNLQPSDSQAVLARQQAGHLPGGLRRVRLDHAHQQLCAASPGDGVTVTEVATRWGFASPSRFAARYHDTYGVPPSHTLRS